MSYLLDQLDYWRDQLDSARARRDIGCVLTCGRMLEALRRLKQEIRRF